jgi:hypothetical protein
MTKKRKNWNRSPKLHHPKINEENWENAVKKAIQKKFQKQPAQKDK